jgi:hypothetical protein
VAGFAPTPELFPTPVPTPPTPWLPPRPVPKRLVPPTMFVPRTPLVGKTPKLLVPIPIPAFVPIPIPAFVPMPKPGFNTGVPPTLPTAPDWVVIPPEGPVAGGVPGRTVCPEPPGVIVLVPPGRVCPPTDLPAFPALPLTPAPAEPAPPAPEAPAPPAPPVPPPPPPAWAREFNVVPRNRQVPTASNVTIFFIDKYFAPLLNLFVYILITTGEWPAQISRDSLIRPGDALRTRRLRCLSLDVMLLLP